MKSKYINKIEFLTEFAALVSLRGTVPNNAHLSEGVVYKETVLLETLRGKSGKHIVIFDYDNHHDLWWAESVSFKKLKEKLDEF